MTSGFGYSDVMEMPWTQARDFVQACARIKRDDLAAMAIAGRAAHADSKGFEAFLRELNGKSG